MGIGIGVHMVKANAIARVGAPKNSSFTEVAGLRGSLTKSLIPSAMGCNRPYPTTLGPFRICIYPNTFRSKRVRKATASSTGTR